MATKSISTGAQYVTPDSKIYCEKVKFWRNVSFLGEYPHIYVYYLLFSQFFTNVLPSKSFGGRTFS
jgi:hypothetical protein